VLSERLLLEAGVEPLIADLPEGVEVTMRMNGDRRLLFVQNYMDQPVSIARIPAGADLLDGGKPVQGGLSLEGYGCAVIQLS
jgi:beta-galactosidase